MKNDNVKSESIAFIHILRGLAALIVMFYHWFVVFFTNNKLCTYLSMFNEISFDHRPFWLNLTDNLGYLDLGKLGVSIFFFITGYLIVPSVEKSGTTKFLIKKALRIYPLYFVGLLFTTGIVYASASINNIAFPYDISIFLKNLSLFRSLFWVASIDGVQWTLECQVFFYLICAFLFWLNREKWSSDKTMVVLGLGATLFIFIAYQFMSELVYTHFPLYVLFYYLSLCLLNTIIMLVGTCFYNFTQKIWTIGQFLRTVVILIVFTAINFGSLYGEACISSWVSYGIGLAVFAVFWILRDKISNFNGFVLLKHFADISFPFYIIHGAAGDAVMAFLYRFFNNPYIVTLITFVIFILLALALNRLIEKPVSKLSKRLLNRKSAVSEECSVSAQ